MTPTALAAPRRQRHAHRADRARRMNIARAAVMLAAGLVGLLAAGLSGCAGTAGRASTALLLPAEAAAQVVLTAMHFVDAPYRRGGNGEAEGADGFDCSGFTRHVYERSLGLALPRVAWEQARDPALREVGSSELQAGDLVFFNTSQRPFSHVGIYVGEGRFIHAPRPGLMVRLEDMRGPQGRYWAQRFDGARRATVSALPRRADAGPPARDGR